MASFVHLRGVPPRPLPPGATKFSPHSLCETGTPEKLRGLNFSLLLLSPLHSMQAFVSMTVWGVVEIDCLFRQAPQVLKTQNQHDGPPPALCVPLCPFFLSSHLALTSALPPDPICPVLHHPDLFLSTNSPCPPQFSQPQPEMYGPPGTMTAGLPRVPRDSRAAQKSRTTTRTLFEGFPEALGIICSGVVALFRVKSGER